MARVLCRNSTSDRKKLTATWLDLGLIDKDEAERLMQALRPNQLTNTSQVVLVVFETRLDLTKIRSTNDRL
jgi:hypothetical protein